MQTGILQLLMPTLTSGVFGTPGQPQGDAAGSAFAEFFAHLQAQLGTETPLLPAEALMAAKAALLAQAVAGEDLATAGTVEAADGAQAMMAMSPEAVALLATLIPVNVPELALQAPALKSLVPPATVGSTAEAVQWIQSLGNGTVTGEAGSTASGTTAVDMPVPGGTVTTPASSPPTAAVIAAASGMQQETALVSQPKLVAGADVPETVNVQSVAKAAVSASPQQVLAATATVVEMAGQKVLVQSPKSAPVAGAPKTANIAVAVPKSPEAMGGAVTVDASVELVSIPQSSAANRSPLLPGVRAAELLQPAMDRPVQALSALMPDVSPGAEQQAGMASQMNAVSQEASPTTAPQQALPTAVTLPELEAQAAKAVRVMMQDGEQRITLRLIPEHLGEVRIEVRSQGDQVTVRVLSANAAIRDALEGQLHGLREAFVREGLTVHRVEVASNAPALHTAGGSGNAGREAAYQPGSRSHNSPQPGNTSPYPQSSDITPRRAAAAHRGALNVFV